MSTTSLHVETLGCRLNAFESEAMKTMAADAGLRKAIVVNTCAVTAEAVRKAKQDIRRLARANPGVPLIVTGCAAQTEPATFSAMPEVTHLIGNREKMLRETWADISAKGQHQPASRVAVGDIMADPGAPAALIDGFGRHRAYVQIQNGCDHRCTFCVIPYGRGNSRSLPADTVVEQIKRLVDKGFGEVVLTGVDLTGWRGEVSDAARLGGLVTRILREVPDLQRLRLSSIDSIEVDEQLMQAIATEPRLMPHLHLSLQHGDDLILKRMKRRHLREDAIRFCEEARRLRPEIVFGADIIAGFPTETDAMFANACRLVDECGLTFLHVFPFSPRAGTPAARMPQVRPSIIRSRAAALREIGRNALRRHLLQQVGTRHRILLEGPYRGRTEQFTEVAFSVPQKPGSIVPATILGQDGQRLLA